MAWHFDETSGEHIQITDDPVLTFPDADWTLAGWIRLDDNVGSGFQYFVSWRGFNDTNNIQWLFAEASVATYANKLGFELQDADADNVGNPTPVYTTGTPGTSTIWQHIALTRTGAGVFTQYVNGVADGTATGAATVAGVAVASPLRSPDSKLSYSVEVLNPRIPVLVWSE